MDAGQIVKGLGWSALGTLVSGLCQIGFMAALARLLDPSAFGLMGMAAVAPRFAGFFAQTGFAPSLIQRAELAPGDATAALLMATGLGAVLYLATLLAAPGLAAALRAPEIAPVIGVLGLSLVLGPVGSLPLALLRRQARFKRVNAIEVAALLGGFGTVGVFCASRGLGVWSLVAATLMQQAMIVLLGFSLLRYPLVWPVRRHAFTSFWGFGSRYSCIGLLEFLFGNVETLIIGRWFGKVELGLYNRAAMLTNLPVELGIGAVNKVLFPALSGMTDDRRRLGDGFQVLLLGVGLFSAAIACAVAAAAPDVVALLLGPRWVAIGPVATVLALAVPATFMYVACGVTLDSLAALGPKLRLQAGMLAMKLAALGLLAGEGLLAIAWVVVWVETLRLALGMRLVGRLLGVSAARLLTLAALVVLSGLAVALAVLAARGCGQTFGMPLVTRVLLETLFGGASFAGALLWMAVRFRNYVPLERLRRVQQALFHSRPVRALQP